MNIIVSAYCVTRRSGGVLDAVKELFLNNAFLKHQIDVYSFNGKYIDEDIKLWGTIPMHLYDAGPFLFSSQYSKDILESKADLLHLEALWRYPQTLSSKWKHKTNKPIVCSPHGMLDPWILQKQGWGKRLFANLFLQKSLRDITCFHALCMKELEDIRQYGLTQPVAIIPNGIYLPDRNKKYKRIDNQKHLLYLGRLHKKKGVDILLKAIAQKQKEFKEQNWILDIVGWDNDGSEDQLKKIVEINHIEKLVVFHGGMFGEDKTRMYATSDAYILPSHGEGLPMTILEAWGWELPVLMTPQCNLPEGFEANAAIMIDDNVESVANGIEQLLKMSEQERRTIGLNGLNLVKEKFTWDSAAKKMIKLYSWLLNKESIPDFVYL